ncbi:hypothetical protein [Maritimibacter dapengensis]|uniref:Adenylosuccinate lyase n=1 Tax=Maritimibacter dapengensis TaxID=2836868 RepID=A0ABS6SZK9_9RHOB|nr:hypothetical protein [Maritimibacter dapengensis]MBV7378365.1 hypothetical protein [Maritimibacter dapengensis]
MILKTLIASAALALAPVAALAQESTSCERAHANCKDGTTYDEKTKTCVVVSS